MPDNNSPQQFRKKPVVIEAMQIDGTYERMQEIVQWVNANTPGFDTADMATWAVYAYYGELKIRTLEGEMTAKPGDWIIRGVKGEFYPCKPDIFAATYGPARGSVDGREAPPRRHVDMSRGEVQCNFILPSTGGYLNCGLILGHSGPHETAYRTDQESDRWKANPAQSVEASQDVLEIFASVARSYRHWAANTGDRIRSLTFDDAAEELEAQIEMLRIECGSVEALPDARSVAPRLAIEFLERYSQLPEPYKALTGLVTLCLTLQSLYGSAVGKFIIESQSFRSAQKVLADYARSVRAVAPRLAEIEKRLDELGTILAGVHHHGGLAPCQTCCRILKAKNVLFSWAPEDLAWAIAEIKRLSARSVIQSQDSSGAAPKAGEYSQEGTPVVSVPPPSGNEKFYENYCGACKNWHEPDSPHILEVNQQGVAQQQEGSK